MTNPFEDIERFGSACDQEPSEANYDMYLSLIAEEYNELADAIAADDRVEQLDALIDILVVTWVLFVLAAMTEKVPGKK